MSSVENLVKEMIARDRKTFLRDARFLPKYHKSKLDSPDMGSDLSDMEFDSLDMKSNLQNTGSDSLDMGSDLQDTESDPSDTKILADFTEYNPLHKGHLHCLLEAKKKVPNGIFVAVVPGLFERSGRGLPYIMTRQARARAAIAVGADIVVEGPPMGIMGSGQYSLCLAKTFQALNVDYIPRGYKPDSDFKILLEKIDKGTGVAPKPYRMVDMGNGEVLLKGKLNEDNYVIVSLSKSLTKIGFNFQNKFIFIPRIKGVSGTVIREAVVSGVLESAEEMLPPETIRIMREEMEAKRAPLHQTRDEETILFTANNTTVPDLKSLSLLDGRTIENMIDKRPFNTLTEIESCIARGFSRHHVQRVLSSLEARIDGDTMHRYIENYPSTIRILNYKNKEVLREFKKRLSHRRLEICQSRMETL
ncbi:nucleotidyltransferase family protein [uncultured Methanobacterium sp.]|uniref:nucleotidyltransferase family protein n=1 Tax=uncultured Methanobacterium sp. TaxID=176306 RepID=UPI002AA60796|nr:nucleotidyltransferase family protein [uncultured Methanobacterium sp.]